MFRRMNLVFDEDCTKRCFSVRHRMISFGAAALILKTCLLYWFEKSKHCSFELNRTSYSSPVEDLLHS